MSYSEEMKNPETGSKQKKWWIVLTVILAVCALPILLPLGLAIGACALGLVLAIAAGLLGLLLGGGVCILAGLAALAAFLISGVIGVGVGIVILFTAPASGLAVLGMSLVSAGGAVLGWMLVWQLAKLFIKAVRWLVNKIGASSRHQKKASVSVETVTATAAEPEKETVFEEKEQEQEERSDEA